MKRSFLLVFSTLDKHCGVIAQNQYPFRRDWKKAVEKARKENKAFFWIVIPPGAGL